MDDGVCNYWKFLCSTLRFALLWTRNRDSTAVFGLSLIEALVASRRGGVGDSVFFCGN